MNERQFANQGFTSTSSTPLHFRVPERLGKSAHVFFRCLVVGAIFCLMLCEAFGTPVSAQVVLRNREDDKDQKAAIERLMKDSLTQKEQSVFVPIPREILRPLFQADRAIKEKDMTRAVSLLGEVLSDSSREDYLVPVLGVENVSMSLRIRAQEVLGSLPAKDRELYRLRYGVQAKQMLERAIVKSSFEEVSMVMQRFFFTDAGFDAAMLLGHHHLDHGRPVAAANCFLRITSSPEARSVHDPEASVLLATCWLLGDSASRATDALTTMKKRTTQDSIEFMGRRVQLFANSDQAIPWLSKLIGSTPLRDVEIVNQWVMSGGNPQRNARSGTGFPLLAPLWSVPVLNDPDLEQKVAKLQTQFIHLKSAPIPAVQPLAVGETILMRSFDQMIGVDFQTGKRLWVYPPPDFTANIGDDGDLSRSVTNTPLTERLWLDSVYGQASSDGSKIFVVPQPGFSKEAARTASTKFDPLLQRSMNELQAIDIERQGAFLWQVGGATGMDEPKLAKTFFLGAPLPIGGELYIVGRRDTQIFLFVLDSQSGNLNWEQLIGTSETSLALEKDRFRRLAGAMPSFSNGILVCSTGTGALVGVDVSSRSLLWGYQYTSPGRTAVQPISPTGDSNNDPMRGLWRDTTITIADGRVIHTPVDSQDLICVDLQNGFPVWDAPGGKSAKTPRKNSLFVACVENGNAVLIGQSKVRAVNLKTGKDAWEVGLGKLGRPSGRGYTNRGHYFFPTTAKKMVQVSLKQGKIVKTTDTSGVLGNLICYRGEVISHGVDKLSTFPQDEPNRRLVEIAESEGKMTPELLAIRSQLQLQDGLNRDAIESIELAFTQRPNLGYENLLHDLILELINEDFEFGVSKAKKYEARLMESRKFEFIAAKVNGLVQSKQPSEAVKLLLELLKPIREVSKTQNEYLTLRKSNRDQRSSDKRIEANSNSSNKIRLDRWVASQIELIHEQFDEAGRTKLRASLNERLEGTAGLLSLDRFAIFRALPTSLIHPSLRLELAKDLLVDGHEIEAIAIFHSFDSELNRPERGIIAGLLATKFADEKMPAESDRWLDRLETEFALGKVSGDRSGKTLATALRKRLQSMSKPPAKIDSFEFTAVEVSETKSTSEKADTFTRIELLQCDIEEMKSWKFDFVGATSELQIRDANGKLIHQFVTRDSTGGVTKSYNAFSRGRLSVKDNLAMLDIGRELMAFDLIKLKSGRTPFLWSKAISGGAADQSGDSTSEAWGEVRIPNDSNNYEFPLYVSPSDMKTICYIDSTDLVGLDSLTGKELWRRSALLPGSILLGDEENVVVWNAVKRVAKVFSLNDGHIVSEVRIPDDAGTVWEVYKTKVLVSTVRVAADQGSVQPLLEPRGRRKSNTKKKPLVKMAKTLGLFDLVENKFVWEKEYPARDDKRRVRSTIACRVGQDRIAVLQPGEDLKVLNVFTGDVVLSTPVKLSRIEANDLDGIGIIEKQDKLLVHLRLGYCSSRDSVTNDLEYLYVNYSRTTWDGALMCIDAGTGNNLWRKPVRFSNLQLGIDQPDNSPLYVLLRKVTDSSRGNRESKTQILAISLETGELVANSTSEPTSGYQAMFDFAYSPEEHTLKMSYDKSLVTMRCVYDEEAPPAPVAYLLKENTIPPEYRARGKFQIDSKQILAGKKRSLERAVATESNLQKRQAEEKRLLELEKSGR